MNDILLSSVCACEDHQNLGLHMFLHNTHSHVQQDILVNGNFTT
jgi:hypothetical protein